MTPDTRMVTDREAAAWLKRYSEPGSAAIYSAPIVLALLADRERWMALAANEHIECFECATVVAINGGQTKEHTCPVEQARELLKEARGES